MKRTVALALCVGIGTYLGYELRDQPVSMVIGGATGVIFFNVYMVAAELERMINNLRQDLNLGYDHDAE